MIINFDENNNINNNKKLFEFILDKFGIENPISFEGSLNNDGLPIGICNILYKNKKFKSIKFTCNNNSELEGPGYIVSNKGNSINFMFYKDNYAKIDYPSGSSYNGEVSQLKKDGYGIYTTNEGSTFEGTFYNDKFNGEYKATFLDKTTSVVTFVDNQFNGKFEKKLDKNTTLTANYQNGTVISFKYENDTDDFVYVLTKPTKNALYEISGFGKMYFKKELVYEGNFDDGIKEGLGTEYYSDGSKYVGNFVCDIREGEGTLFDKNGNVLKAGTWFADEFVEESNSKNTKTQKKLTSQKTLDVVSLKNSIKNIENNIVGQKEVIDQIANNLLLSFLCEREDNKPITSILMTGPTGVGKTETAKQISEHIYNKKPYVVDFANFYGKHMIASLIGSPAGYIGSDEKPALIKYIEENQETGGVILFEEIDKADTECLNIFMRMLDEGEIISSKNVAYSVKNFIILSTTNMSVNYVKKLGFSNTNDIKDTLVKESTGMKKEQLARFSLVCEFQDLEREDKIILCKKAIEETVSKLKNIQGYNINIEYSENIFGEIVDKTNMDFGVREIKKQASKEITQKLARFIRNNEAKNITVKIIDLDNIEIIATDKISNKNIDSYEN